MKLWIKSNVGRHYEIDNSRSLKLFPEITCRPIEESLKAAVDSLVVQGHVEDLRNSSLTSEELGELATKLLQEKGGQSCEAQEILYWLKVVFKDERTDSGLLREAEALQRVGAFLPVDGKNEVLIDSHKPTRLFKAVGVKNVLPESVPKFNIAEEKYVRIVEETMAELLDQARGGIAEGWSNRGSKHDVLLSRRAEAGSPISAFRGSGVIEAPVAEVAACLEHQIKWDPLLANIVVLKQIGPNTQIRQHQYVANQCIVKVRRHVNILQHSEQMEDGSHLVVTTSHLADDFRGEHPPVKDSIEGAVPPQWMAVYAN